MNQRERNFWKNRLRPALVAAGIHAERIENAAGVGRPDVDTVYLGAILPCELKAIEKFPARKGTAVLGSKGLRKSQRNWFLNWSNAGGKALIIVAVGQEVFAFGWRDADHVNDFNTGQFRAAAIAHGIPEIIDLIQQQGKK